MKNWDLRIEIGKILSEELPYKEALKLTDKLEKVFASELQLKVDGETIFRAYDKKKKEWIHFNWGNIKALLDTLDWKEWVEMPKEIYLVKK